MSRTREEVRVESPVKATIFYNGEKGSFGRMSDVEGGGIQDVPLPLHFVVLDNSTHRVTGKKSLEKDAPRYRSTLAHDSRTKKLRVWINGASEKTIAEGAWGAIQEQLPGAKFTRCIYAMCNFGDGSQIYCIQLHGRALFCWMDYLKKNGIDPCSNVAFSVKKTEMMEGKVGKPSLVPVFTNSPIQEETVKAAAEMDNILQAWLDTIFAQGGVDGALTQEDYEAQQPAPASHPANSRGGYGNAPQSFHDDFPTDEPVTRGTRYGGVVPATEDLDLPF